MQAVKDMNAGLPESKSPITCEVCGNEYDKSFEIKMDGVTHVFDSFECAIHALAPKCANCGIRIIGHGMEANGQFFCCAHCAGEHGIHEVEDRVDNEVVGKKR